jgi:dUTP pyrophosphatase
MDLCACIDTPITIAPRQLVTVPTGLAIALPNSGCVALLFGRSGLGVKHGITLSNSVGVIDSDYRGELKVGLCNLSDTPYIIQPNERIAQLVITPVLPLPVEPVDELDETARGEGGFGSTGK